MAPAAARVADAADSGCVDRVGPQASDAIDGVERRDAIRVARDGAAVTVWLANPTRRNAITGRMLLELERVLDELASDASVRVVVFRGDAAGGAFSAGVDLADVLAMLEDDGVPTGGLLARVTRRIRNLRAVTIAAIEGACMGGAWMLAAECDVRLGDDRLRIGLTPVRLGIVFPFDGVARLVELVGLAAATDLLVTGRTVGSDEAVRLGLVRTVEGSASFDHAIADHVRDSAALSPASVSATKQALDLAAAGERSTHSTAIRDAYLAPVVSGDAAEGVAAFLAKRAPRWPSATRDARGTPSS